MMRISNTPAVQNSNLKVSLFSNFTLKFKLRVERNVKSSCPTTELHLKYFDTIFSLERTFSLLNKKCLS